MAREVAKKKLLWIMSVVKAISFVQKLKKRVKDRKYRAALE